MPEERRRGVVKRDGGMDGDDAGEEEGGHVSWM